MTEEQIERVVEFRTNSIDRAYMNGGLTDAEYKLKLRALDRWAERKLRGAR